jgi:inhibitor of cysteine peptidase
VSCASSQRVRRGAPLGALLFALLLVACATAAPPGRPWQITEADAGRSIRVPIGTVLDVALPGNPTTGFIWQRSPGDPGGIETVGAARFEPSGSAMGQGGLVHVQFRVTKVGATVLWLVYRRPFEKDVPPAKTFSVTIVGDPD